MTAGAGLGGAFVHRRRKGAGGRRVPGKMGRPGPLRGGGEAGPRAREGEKEKERDGLRREKGKGWPV